MRTRLVLIAALFLLPALAGAQDVKVKVTVDSTRYLIGEWIVASLHVDAPKEATLRFPKNDDDIEGGDFVALGEKTLEADGLRSRIRREITMTVFDTGQVALNVLLRYRLPGDTTTYIARSNTLTLAIGTVALDTTITFKDIKDVMHVSLPWWVYVLIVLASLLLAAGIWYAWRWYKRKAEEVDEAPVEEVRPEIPPHVEALRSLDRLQSDAPWLRGAHKEAQSRLSDIARRYLERRFVFPAMEETTGEIIRNARATTLRPVLVQELEQALRVADLTKFARFEPTVMQHEHGLATVYSVVRESIPRETFETDDAIRNENADEQQGGGRGA